MSGPIAPRMIHRIVADFPELREDYGITMVEIMQRFSDMVWEAFEQGGDEGFIERAFEFVEELAASGDSHMENLVTVVFIEAAPYGIEARHRLGPHTRRLVDQITGFDLEGLRDD